MFSFPILVNDNSECGKESDANEMSFCDDNAFESGIGAIGRGVWTKARGDGSGVTIVADRLGDEMLMLVGEKWKVDKSFSGSGSVA